ncbi:hypothetical protein, partial [Nitrosospira multiformis]|uniref:hypothetical protein n=1 Tax=Nitrosospira multiformis TaxID=1231 RepID=UPI001C435CC2
KSNNLLIRKSLLHVRSPLEKRTLLDSKWHVLLGAHQNGTNTYFPLLPTACHQLMGLTKLL